MSRPTRWLPPVAAAALVAPVLLLAVAAAADAAEASTEQAAAEEAAVVVVVRSFTYGPDPVQVTAGSQVRWRWEGDGRHSATAVDRSFDSDPDCEDNVLLRENCRTGGDEDFVWTAPDVAERTEIPYACKLHGESEGMTGTVVVVPQAAASPSPTSSEEPSASPSPSAGPSGSPDDGGEDGAGGSDDDPPPQRETGTAPQLGTQTAPGSSSSVASPEVAEPVADPDLEPFPSPAPIPSPSETDDLGEVALDLPDDDGGRLRTVLLTVATVAVTGSAVAFGQLVLFGPRWR